MIKCILEFHLSPKKAPLLLKLTNQSPPIHDLKKCSLSVAIASQQTLLL